jgi:hypothetical protein
MNTAGDIAEMKNHVRLEHIAEKKKALLKNKRLPHKFETASYYLNFTNYYGCAKLFLPPPV